MQYTLLSSGDLDKLYKNISFKLYCYGKQKKSHIYDDSDKYAKVTLLVIYRTIYNVHPRPDDRDKYTHLISTFVAVGQ